MSVTASFADIVAGPRTANRVIWRLPSKVAARQSNLEDRPVRFVCQCHEATAMGLDDHATNGKPYSGPGGLCCKKRFEDAVFVLTSQSRTRVFHCDHNIGGLLDDVSPYMQAAR